MFKHTETICWQKPTNCLSVFDHFVELMLKGLNVLWLGKHSSERIGRFSVTVYMNRPLLTLELIIWIIHGLDNVTWNQTLCFFNQIVFPTKTRFSISILVVEGALPPTAGTLCWRWGSNQQLVGEAVFISLCQDTSIYNRLANSCAPISHLYWREGDTPQLNPNTNIY